MGDWCVWFTNMLHETDSLTNCSSARGLLVSTPKYHNANWSLLTLQFHSPDGDAWSHFTYDMARSRAFRWGEDGIAGVSDTHGKMNIAFSFWNEKE